MIFPYAEYARKLINHWLACTKLVTRWLCIRKNWLLTGWAYMKIILAHHDHFQSFSSLPPVTHSSVPFSCLFQTSFIHDPFSLVCVRCLPSYIYPVSRICPQSYFFVPCTLVSIPVSMLCSLSPILCTLSHVICSLSPILLSLFPNPYKLFYL